MVFRIKYPLEIAIERVPLFLVRLNSNQTLVMFSFLNFSRKIGFIIMISLNRNNHQKRFELLWLDSVIFGSLAKIVPCILKKWHFIRKHAICADFNYFIKWLWPFLVQCALHTDPTAHEQLGLTFTITFDYRIMKQRVLLSLARQSIAVKFDLNVHKKVAVLKDIPILII